MNDLRRRLQATILARFNQDKRKAIAYLQKKCSFYAHKADSKRGTKHYARWHDVYEAYRNAEFSLSYYLSLDEDFDREMAEDVYNGQEEYYCSPSE